MAEKNPSILASIHPEYLERTPEWQKFRSIMKGGDSFIEEYVEKFSDSESDSDFERRKGITPVAGFAKAAVIDIQNSIFQRLWAIRRKGGAKSWQAAVKGQLGGVNLQGATMNHFMGTEILPELLGMGKVGIYVDNIATDGKRTLLEAKHDHPYIYSFVAEDIRNWQFFHVGNELKLKNLLLRVRSEHIDDQFFLADAYVEEFRNFWVDEAGNVNFKFYDYNGMLYLEGTLDMPEIPFVLLELQASLLEDIANHQIALTNMESADVAYSLRSNVPFYTEQYDPNTELAKNWSNEDSDGNADGDGDNTKAIKIGSTSGRRYPKNTDRPEFINPSSEPLEISIAKQRELKGDIRSLVNLALSSTRPRFASAESKELDDRGLESGLSAVGLVLENAERKIGELWATYENVDEQVTVSYPERYSLRSDEERRKDANQLAESAKAVSSPTFRRVIQKEIAEILLEGKVSDEELDQVMQEIEESKYPTSDPEQIRNDVEMGLLSRKSGSIARGYPEGEAEAARKEKEEMELLRMRAQTKGFGSNNPAARGLDDSDPEAAALEKQQSQDPDNNVDGIKAVRGKAK
jgi:hypothetical protein